MTWGSYLTYTDVTGQETICMDLYCTFYIQHSFFLYNNINLTFPQLYCFDFFPGPNSTSYLPGRQQFGPFTLNPGEAATGKLSAWTWWVVMETGIILVGIGPVNVCAFNSQQKMFSPLVCG